MSSSICKEHQEATKKLLEKLKSQKPKKEDKKK